MIATKIKDTFKLESAADLDPLMEKIGDAKYVLLGEASHGTHEYYTWRTEISKRLIREKGFSFIAVEGDWPDCYQINRWVKGYPFGEEKIRDVLSTFKRWPTWMWANWEVAALAEWMKAYNDTLPIAERAGFYGLDVYSLSESMEVLVEYLQQADPETAELAFAAMRCFEPYKNEDGYAEALRALKPGCRKEIIFLLDGVRKNAAGYNGDPEAGLNAEINAMIAANAEWYYRALVSFDHSSWNVRDRHMAETLDLLMKHHGSEAKAIVWEHNTHIGDARATDMSKDGLLNVGQLVREKHRKEGVVLVGFGSYEGAVIAGKYWGAPMEEMPLPPAEKNSLEFFLHHEFGENRLLLLNANTKNLFQEKIGHRAIGVVYAPARDKRNYVPTLLSGRYDAFIYLDQTKALHPLHLRPDGHLIPETYPFAM